jgi:hypothetical protein
MTKDKGQKTDAVLVLSDHQFFIKLFLNPKIIFWTR